MLVKMAEAIGRIVLAGREMTRLAGSVVNSTLLILFFALSLTCKSNSAVAIVFVFLMAIFLLT